MDEKRKLGVIAFLFMLFVVCKAEKRVENGYIFTCPRSLKIGQNNELQFVRFGTAEEVILTATLFCEKTYNTNETFLQSKDFILPEGEKTVLLDFFVNPVDPICYSAIIKISGSGDERIEGSTGVYLSKAKEALYFIQTDKPLYKEGQTVEFRCLRTDNNLKPISNGKDKVLLTIEDPKRTRFFEQTFDLSRGMVQGEFLLSDEPAFGVWTIGVYTLPDLERVESMTFEVKKYQLPKSEITFKNPPYVLANAKTVTIQICFNTTTGQPLKGVANINVSVERYSWNQNEKIPVIHKSKKFFGCVNITTNIHEIDPNNTYLYRALMWVVQVVEDGTGVVTNKTNIIYRENTPLFMNFVSDQSYQQYLKFGLPYYGKLKVTHPDHTPAAKEPVEICSTVHRSRNVCNWSGKRIEKNCCNYTSDYKGEVPFTIPPQNTDAESLELQARSLKYARLSQKAGARTDILNIPTAFSYLVPYSSPSGRYIQIQTIGEAIPCETTIEFRVLFTAKEDTEFNLRYVVLKQGQTMKTGTLDVVFAVEDDISKECENEDGILNCVKTQILPDPHQKSSKNNCLDDGNNPCFEEAKFLPYIGEAYIPIDVASCLSPGFNLLIYYVTPKGEVVADSQKIEVEKCFKNKVTFEFGDKEKQPGTETSITVTSSPNSLCGLRIIDKSVTILDPSKQLTKEKIFQLRDSMDTGIYYSDDPCTQDIGQAGFKRRSGRRIMPRPSYSSQVADAHTAIQIAGLAYISNMRVVTRPCTKDVGYGFGNGGGAVPLMSTAVRRTASKSLAREGVAFDAEMQAPRVPSTVSAVEERKNFPETWLFNMVETGPDGTYKTKRDLPDTITEWDGNAVCINAKDGLGLSNTAFIKGFQDFYISLTYPVSVVRGEKFVVPITCFSNVGKYLAITLSVIKSALFTITSDIGEDICISPHSSETRNITLVALALGHSNLTVRAESAKDTSVCRSSDVYDGLARDAITQQIEVRSEGFPNEKCQNLLMCPEGETFRSTISLNVPEDVVDGSSTAIIDVTGNVMGPAIKNMNNLVTLPTGCGEQNMAKFTGNCLVLDYLHATNEVTPSIEKRAIQNLNTGYQRQMNYRHPDESYSAFGTVDKEGSMFLTAFCFKYFNAAQRYISISKSILTAILKWIFSKQLKDGSFPNVGQIIDIGIQGGLSKENSRVGITAYVLSCILPSHQAVSGNTTETATDNALSFVSKNVDTTYPYECCLSAYALALGGRFEEAKKLIDGLEPSINKTDDVEYYRNPNGVKSLDIETTANCVLAKLTCGFGLNEVIGAVRFLMRNLNSNGGLQSTQDTAVGLAAISEVAKLMKAPNMEVTCTNTKKTSFDIDEGNKNLVQRTTVLQVPGEIEVKAEGSGCALLQCCQRYYTQNPPGNPSFFLNVEGKCTNQNENKCEITVTVSGPPTMCVLELNLITGMSVDGSLDYLKADKSYCIAKTEIEPNKVFVYFMGLQKNKDVKFSISFIRHFLVTNPQPATAKFYDYYNPDHQAETNYRLEN